MTTNKNLTKAMAQEMSKEFNERMPQTLSDNAVELYAVMEDYPTLKNEFIDTLTNKVIKSRFYDKVFTNKLSIFHKGRLEYGDSVEDLFVEMANKKGFREHFEGSTSVESDLIGVQKPKVNVKYHSKNFEYKYKVTISEDQLKTAFFSSTGLSQLVSRVLTSLTNGAYFDEYTDMKSLLFDACKGVRKTLNTTTGLPQETALTSKDIAQPLKTISIANFATSPKNLTETIRGLAGRMEFPSTEYNMAGVKQYSSPSDLVFITLPETVAKLDVNVLAEAFNVSKAELNTRTVTVDSLPTSFAPTIGGQETTKKCLGLLVDKDFLQAYDTILTMRKHDNGANLTVNHFLHKQGLLYNCYFVNAVALIEE